MILVKINVEDHYHNKAAYIFDLFAQIWGIPVVILQSDSPARADLIYASAGSCQERCDDTVVIRCEPKLYEPNTVCQLSNAEEILLWTHSPLENSAHDVVASSYRLITFMDESQVCSSRRDRFGRFRLDALPTMRRNAAKLPLIENHSEYVLRQILRQRPGLKADRIPRWPNNKRYVISMTHDTDAVRLSAPREMLSNILKAILRRNKTYFEMFKSGLRHINQVHEDPFFAFPVWRELELAAGFRSCFYLHVKPRGTKFSIHDCRSDVTDRRMNWDILRSMAGEGWEFGLHAPIHSKDSVDAFAISKRFLEERLETPVHGLRHHYYALDWFRPWVTFEKHVDAGFRYDTSIAWREATGFRAATCLPFHPFNPETNRPLSLYELPMCLMDGHVMGKDVAHAAERGIDILQEVRKIGGVGVLNWHTETGCNSMKYKNYLTGLKQILKPFLEDSDAWFAAPWEIVKHWEERASRITLGDHYQP